MMFLVTNLILKNLMVRTILLLLLLSLPVQALQILQPKDGYKTVKQSFSQVESTLSPTQLLTRLEKSAKSGNAREQFSLANMYHGGIGVKQDLRLSFYWYTQVAEQGYANAQFRLANYYHQGIGIDRDMNEAMHGIKNLPSKILLLPNTHWL